MKTQQENYLRNCGIGVAMGILALTVGALSAAAQPQVSFTFQNVSVPGAAETDAYAINDKNVIAGDYFNAAGQQIGLFLSGKKVTSVSCPDGGPTVFTGVNSSGTAVEGLDDGPGGAAAKGLDDGGDDYCGNGATTYLILHHEWGFTPQNWGSIYTVAYGINDVGIVVGQWIDSSNVTHGFSYNLDADVFTDIDVPDAVATVAWAVNNAGVITLQAEDPNGNWHAYLFNGSSFTQIDVPGAAQTFVYGINNNGDVVYSVEDATGNDWGVFFYADVQQFIWFNNSDGRDTTRAFGLNDEVITKTGNTTLKIVGEYTAPASGQNYAYEATVTIKP